MRFGRGSTLRDLLSEGLVLLGESRDLGFLCEKLLLIRFDFLLLCEDDLLELLQVLMDHKIQRQLLAARWSLGWEKGGCRLLLGEAWKREETCRGRWEGEGL